jgi:hypothetical protein
MKLRLVAIAIASALSLPAFANHAAAEAANKMVQLADGGTLYIFKDGSMAREDRFGRASYLTIGSQVKAKDGTTIAVTSNEVARLDWLLSQNHGS